MSKQLKTKCIRFPVEQIYTNGAFVRPEPVIKDGRQMWQWVVSEFIDESFYDEEPYFPVELAETREGLVDTKAMLESREGNEE